jgi:hypothetical protein
VAKRNEVKFTEIDKLVAALPAPEKGNRIYKEPHSALRG